MPDPILIAEALEIGYVRPRQPARLVVGGIDVRLEPGELVCLLGPNGAGKSTLLRTIAGMQPALAGTIRLLGDEVGRLDARELARRMSIVLTERVSAGGLSVYALVALGRHPYTGWDGRLSEQDEAVVRWAIEAVGARDLAGRQVDELSDGERQKVMIARALAQQPNLMLLDEPTAFLDLPHRIEIMHILRQLAHSNEQAILLSTHDLDLALRSADRIWLLPAGGPLQTGAPEDLVLNGAFERTFASAGLSFDPLTGAFSLRQAGAAQVAVSGEGPRAVWARRALEREGFAVVAAESAPPPRIAVRVQDAAPYWRCAIDGSEVGLESVGELVRFLREQAPVREHAPGREQAPERTPAP